jgi:hypothetical protein
MHSDCPINYARNLEDYKMLTPSIVMDHHYAMEPPMQYNDNSSAGTRPAIPRNATLPGRQANFIKDFNMSKSFDAEHEDPFRDHHEISIPSLVVARGQYGSEEAVWREASYEACQRTGERRFVTLASMDLASIISP